MIRPLVESKRSQKFPRWEREIGGRRTMTEGKGGTGNLHAPCGKSNDETDFDLRRGLEPPYDGKRQDEHDQIGEYIHQRTPPIPGIDVNAVAAGDSSVPQICQRNANQKPGNHRSHVICDDQNAHHPGCDSISTFSENAKIQNQDG